MNFNQYTQKSLEAVQSAQNLAVQNSHQQLEQVHLLLALLRQDGGLIPQLLRKMDVTVESLDAAAAALLRKIPGVKPAGKQIGSTSALIWMPPSPPPKHRLRP